MRPKIFPSIGLILITAIVSACASVYPKQATRIAQPDNAPVRNFTSFTPSLRCMDNLLAQSKRPRVLISSTGFPDFSKRVNIGADEMLINAISHMNRKSRNYVFVDQSLEKGFGQIGLLTVDKKTGTQPDYYVRAAVTQVEQDTVKESYSGTFDFTNSPNPPTGIRNGLTQGLSRNVSIVTVDMHLVKWPQKTVVPGSSVANSMVVVTNGRSVNGNGLIKLTGFRYSIQMSRVESVGQAVRNLIELGAIELFGRHAGVPFWECLNIRPTNQKLDNIDEVGFTSTPKPINVTTAQNLLIRLGYLTGAPTGTLDQATRAAISQFQANEDLIATGVLNYQLYLLLQERANGFNKSRSPVPLSRSNENVVALRHQIRSSKDLILEPDRTAYQVGDRLGLSLDIRAPGSVACYHQSGVGPVYQILPVDPNRTVRVARNSRFSVPSLTAGFDIEFETTQKDEAVLCILSKGRNATTVQMTNSPLEPAPVTSIEDITAIYQAQRQRISVAAFSTRAVSATQRSRRIPDSLPPLQRFSQKGSIADVGQNIPSHVGRAPNSTVIGLGRWSNLPSGTTQKDVTDFARP